MIDFFSDLLAQTATQPAKPPPTTPVSPFFNPLTGLILAAVVFYIFLFRGQGKKKKQMENMIKNIKKNDRVLTIGGIVGTVVALKDDEVVVKVDESSNIKMTFVRKAIQRVILDEADKSAS